jgi:hypothetical protein
VLAYFGEDVQPGAVIDWLWCCEECGASDQDAVQLLGSLDEPLDDEAFVRWLETKEPSHT